MDAVYLKYKGQENAAKQRTDVRDSQDSNELRKVEISRYKKLCTSWALKG